MRQSMIVVNRQQLARGKEPNSKLRIQVLEG
jgi:hypothetical protein